MHEYYNLRHLQLEFGEIQYSVKYNHTVRDIWIIFNAPFSDYWLQEPPISSITSIPPPLLPKSYLNRQHNHENTFVIADSSSEYSYLGDSID